MKIGITFLFNFLLLICQSQTINKVNNFYNDLITVEGFKDSVLLNENFFKKGKSEFRDTSFQILDSIAEIIKKSPTLKFQIKVHAKFGDNKTRNKKKTVTQAKLLREYLIKKGVDTNQISSRGVGDEEYLFSNWNTAKPKFVPEIEAPTNFRVELKFYGNTLPSYFYEIDSAATKNGYWTEGSSTTEIAKGIYKNGNRIGIWQIISMKQPFLNQTQFYDYKDGIENDSLPKYSKYLEHIYKGEKCDEKNLIIKDGYNKLYNSCKCILADGEFRCGNMIFNGKVYLYTGNCELIKICIIKRGQLVGFGQKN